MPRSSWNLGDGPMVAAGDPTVNDAAEEIAGIRLRRP
jgi:hypothetical protein